MSDQHRGVPEHVVRAGAAAAADSRLVQAVRSAEHAVTVSDPGRGQIWRAVWDDTAQLVLVLRTVSAGPVLVAPVTIDPPACDESSVVLDAGLTVLGHTATVWGGLAAEIPFGVFDLLIGQIPDVVVETVERVAAGGDAGLLPEGVGLGPRVTSPFDRAAEVRAELSDILERLGGAAWAPEVLEPAQSLRGLLQGRNDVAGLMTDLAQALGLELPAVLHILTGRRPVTAQQAPVIARITGLTEQQVLAAAPALPAELVTELDRPRWRKPLRAQRRSGDSEAVTRLTVAYGTLALAARQTGSTSASAWPQRIRQYLVTHSADGRDR